VEKNLFNIYLNTQIKSAFNPNFVGLFIPPPPPPPLKKKSQ